MKKVTTAYIHHLVAAETLWRLIGTYLRDQHCARRTTERSVQHSAKSNYGNTEDYREDAEDQLTDPDAPRGVIVRMYGRGSHCESLSGLLILRITAGGKDTFLGKTNDTSWGFL